MPFEDRAHAARLLAADLMAYWGRNPLVLAIPRGGLPMGRVLADALHGDLDVVLVHTLRSPDNREFALGSIGEGGKVHVTTAARTYGVGEQHLRAEAAERMERLRRLREFYTPGRGPMDPKGRVVIVVDDGMITGLTMTETLRSVRARHPSRIVAAVAVAVPRTLAMAGELADEVACIEVSDRIAPLDDFFMNFPAIPDEEAAGYLRRNPAGAVVPRAAP